MENPKPSITLRITLNASVSDCWTYWITADDIRKWNHPSDDWHTSYVEIDLQTGGRFLYRMEKKDGSAGFDHAGIYDEVKPFECIAYTGTDGRKSSIHFAAEGGETVLTETFEPEGKTPLDVQRDFCQGVLDNFRSFAEKRAGNALDEELEK